MTTTGEAGLSGSRSGIEESPANILKHETELQQEVKVIGAHLESEKKLAAAIHKDVGALLGGDFKE